MDFSKLPKSGTLPSGWLGQSRQGSALAEREGTQLTMPISPLLSESRNLSVDGALQLSTVWACVNLRANIIASLPLFAYESQGGVRNIARSSRLYGVLHESPNPRMTPFEFWRAMVMNHDLRGRAYARIDRASPGGEAVALWPMPADQVESIVLPDSTMAYVYRVGADVMVLAQENVLHLKGLGNGTEGISKLEYMRATTSEAANAQEAASRLFGNGGKPTGVLMVDSVLKPEQRKALQERFSEMAIGNASRLYVLEANMTYQQLSLTPEDQELLETRRFGVEEICRWFDVPPVLVHHSNVTAWGSGVEQIIEGFYKLSMRPLAVSIEQALKRCVLTSAQRARMTAEFSLDALLRSSPKDRMDIYARAVQNGLKTRNEVRQLENDPPMAGGDFLTVQSNLLPIQMLGKVNSTGVSNAAAQDPVNQ